MSKAKPKRLNTQVRYQMPSGGIIILSGNAHRVDAKFVVGSDEYDFALTDGLEAINSIAIRNLVGTVYSGDPAHPSIPDDEDLRLPIYKEELALCRLMYEEVLTVIMNPLRLRIQNPFK